MNNITKEIMLKKFEEVYQPNNLILCVVGNGEFKDITDFVEKNFPKGNGKIKKIKS